MDPISITMYFALVSAAASRFSDRMDILKNHAYALLRYGLYLSYFESNRCFQDRKR